MPTHLSHLPNITLEYTLVAAKALQDLAKVTQIPFVGSVCSLAQAVVSLVQNSKMQKEKCLQMVEDIHCVLCALTGLCINSDIIIPPEVLERVPQYAHTLQTFHECLKAQEELGTFKRMLKQSAITQQLNVCKRDLSDACIFFKMKQEAEFASTLVDLDIDISERHQELLEMISAQSDSAGTRSSVWQSSFNSRQFGVILATSRVPEDIPWQGFRAE
ncbi:hypothetical protein K438DRAFT_1973463 [Mycena galopus ATCC 62051]|nr:hypothetical protein K438DRAFT_1973463 [Mycena galopus ATCC 62051]